jgi:hypothetical protein
MLRNCAIWEERNGQLLKDQKVVFISVSVVFFHFQKDIRSLIGNTEIPTAGIIYDAVSNEWRESARSRQRRTRTGSL